ncbi:MAG TPA: ABC transporter ATP-binding protein [Lactobacillaceae bacterium]|jgi:ATP-binding cassette subfamily B protein AbcA/BmrA
MRPEQPRGEVAAFKLTDFVKLISSTKPRYLLLIIGVILGVTATLIQLSVPKVAASLVNHFSTHLDYGLLIEVIGLFIGGAVISMASGAILGVFGENVVANLREKVWRQLIALRVKYFDEVKAGEMSSRLSNDTTQVKDLLASTFPRTLSSILTLAGSIIMMVTMDWHMTVAMVIVVPIAMIFIIPLSKFGRSIGHQRQEALAAFSGNASETLSEIRLVKTSNAEEQANEKAGQEIHALYRVGLKEAVFDAASGPIFFVLLMGTIFGLLAYGMHRVATGQMPIGTLLSFLMYMLNFMTAVPMIATLFTEMAKAAGSTGRIRDLLLEPTEDFTSGTNVDVTGKTLSMQHVDFGYGEDLILRDVNFETQPGTVVAFAGPSGGGKSTIFSLLERFYEPTTGAIKIGDQTIQSVNLSDWRRQIGFVSQDSAIMAGTIRDNLTYGLPGEFSDEQLWHVLDLAFAKGFVTAMKEGLDTQVGERGVKVSGGQRQRLAIARAFLRDPKILMLDEATASLDSESEMMVQKALEQLMKNRTTLVIAHRLSTIVDADQIYFIEKGHVSGHGTHRELLTEHALYQEYVATQFKN